MAWRSTAHRARIALVADPVHLIAPLYLRDVLDLHPADAHLPGPLLPPVGEALERPDAIMAATLAGHWSRWWARALGHRPWRPPPTAAEQTVDIPMLRAVWNRASGPFAEWRAQDSDSRDPRPAVGTLPASAADEVDDGAAERFAATRSRRPVARTVAVLVLPVAGGYLHSPAPRLILVAAELRADARAYRIALDAALHHHW